MLFGFLKLNKKKLNVHTRYIVFLSIALSLVWFVFHLILTSRIPMDGFGQFMVDTYEAKTTAGGMLFSLISYPATKYLTIVGAYVVSIIALAIFVGFFPFLNIDSHSLLSINKSLFVASISFLRI